MQRMAKGANTRRKTYAVLIGPKQTGQRNMAPTARELLASLSVGFKKYVAHLREMAFQKSSVNFLALCTYACWILEQASLTRLATQFFCNRDEVILE